MKISVFVALLLATSTLFAQGFTEVSIASGIDHLYLSQMKMGGGAAWFDMDRDGDEDLIMSGGLNHEGLYRNEGNGQFTDITYAAGLGFLDSVQTMGVITCDLDNDGYREIFFTTAPSDHDILLYNNGNGTFSDISISAGIGLDTLFGTSAAAFDYQMDGDIDIYVGNYIEQQNLITDTSGAIIGFDPVCQPNRLWRNDGNLQFTDVAVLAQVADTGCALAVDVWHFLSQILIANDFGAFHVPNQYYDYTGSGTFSNISTSSGFNVPMYGMGIAAADYDHTNNISFYITDIGPNKLLNILPAGTYTNVAAAAGVEHGTQQGLNTTGWGTAFFDYDNDTWADLYACNGHITVVPFIQNVLRDPDKLWRNNGDGTFTDVTMAQGIVDSGMGRGMAVCDYDLDGDVDALTMVIHYDSLSGEHTKLWRNDNTNANHWANIRLEGTVSARDPFGAMVAVIAGNDHWSIPITGGGSHMSQNSSTVHIGLGSHTTYQIWVSWPTGGVQVYNTPTLDSTITLTEDSTQFVIGLPPTHQSTFSIQSYPNPSQGQWALKVNMPTDDDLQLDIYDMQGRLIHTQHLSTLPAGTHTLTFPENTLPTPGTYLLKATTPTHLSTQLLLKQ